MKLNWFERIGENYLTRVRLLPVLRTGRKRYYPPVNLYLHVFHGSDHVDALHDHPWPSVSVRLWGFAMEHYWVEGEGERTRYVPWLRPLYRPATWRHRIEVLDGPMVTLFFVGFKQRDWGFWPKGVFVNWWKYL